MAIKNLFGRGIGFTGGLIGWVVTRGYAAAAAAAAVVTPYTGKYKPEHTDALATLQGLDSFAPTHARALADVTDAGR